MSLAGFYAVGAAPVLPGLAITPSNGALVGPAPQLLQVASASNAAVIGAPVAVGIAAGSGCCGAPAAAVASPLVGAQQYPPCWYFRERIAPPLYMLAANDCAYASVCADGKAYRSFATINTAGANAFLQKGLASFGVGRGCGQTLALAPLVANSCPCLPPHSS